MVRERGPRQIERTEKWQAKKRAEVLSGGVTPETEQSAVSEAAPPSVAEAEVAPASETTTETAGPPLIDEKEELIRKKSAGPGKERKDTGLRQLYESLAQKVRLAEIKSKIPEKVSNKEKKILKKRKESLKNVEIALNYIVRDFDEQEVKIIRDYFLVSFMDIYINARKEKERENGKELNAKESVELKKKEFGKIEQNLLDRYRDKIDRYEDKVEKIMDYFWQMSNLEMLLDK